MLAMRTSVPGGGFPGKHFRASWTEKLRFDTSGGPTGLRSAPGLSTLSLPLPWCHGANEAKSILGPFS
jgi:hypothetical protein